MGRGWRPDWGDRFQGAWSQQLLDYQIHPIIFFYGFQKEKREKELWKPESHKRTNISGNQRKQELGQDEVGVNVY